MRLHAADASPSIPSFYTALARTMQSSMRSEVGNDKIKNYRGKGN